MEKCGGFFLIHKNEDGRSGIALSLLIAILTGAVLSFINFLLMKNNGQIDFAITLQRLAIVLSPAIYEEIVCRAIFMAFCIYIFGPAPTKFQIFTMWFMMTFPHTLAHHQNLMATVILCILFGLPFALLQKKRDIFSAMVSHGLVDAVRFVLFGIGM
jgi:membrane protease YdiL (CAAX protease family)